ncbi:MAG: hypothetical protein HY741_00925 [Chloroflexi bacterium]|nr:hypothetical protein [Chloroflexota bacterium]
MFQVMLELDEEWAANESHRVKGNFDCEIAVSPIIATRRVNAYLAGYVTMMTLPGAPSLVLQDKPVWRFTAYFNYPRLGEIGTLGTIEVDAQTGQVIPLTPEQISAMQERANVIATRLTPQPVAIR